ncbi:SUF system NifU family Fe-S cluster assembly protein [Lentisphaera profundi]|uniref:SUF system NifU family Fe-S cluster assembly protein n=1 Tax=Lentisphaera profundi TaxID=1658616 RepID=A0ABY7VV63_9BACT|nr:SUF system NifU family Fe-S cluster assembly protein [Lentisphaera profundi]WDE96777.1 SUF system NifU family Fe-S cluster assembly protein [Lentisphaera profundi]
MSNQLYQQTVLKHNRDPRNFGEIDDCSHHAEGFNPLCGDEVKVFLQVEGDELKDLKFTGKGCAVSQASASIMTEALKGKKLSEVQVQYEDFIKMASGEKLNPSGEIAAFAGISQFPSRVKCAVLAWKTFNAAIAGADNTISTE